MCFDVFQLLNPCRAASAPDFDALFFKRFPSGSFSRHLALSDVLISVWTPLPTLSFWASFWLLTKGSKREPYTTLCHHCLIAARELLPFCVPRSTEYRTCKRKPGFLTLSAWTSYRPVCHLSESCTARSTPSMLPLSRARTRRGLPLISMHAFLQLRSASVPWRLFFFFTPLATVSTSPIIIHGPHFLFFLSNAPLFLRYLPQEVPWQLL